MNTPRSNITASDAHEVEELAVVLHLDAGAVCVIPGTLCPVLRTADGARLPVDDLEAPLLAEFLESSGPPATFPFVGPQSASVTLHLDNSVTWHVGDDFVGRLEPAGALGLKAIALALRATCLTREDLQSSAMDAQALLLLLTLVGNRAELATVRTTIPPGLRRRRADGLRVRPAARTPDPHGGTRMTNNHVTITCPCGSTDFRGRIEPTFRLRYTATDFEVSPVFEAPEPIDVYCAGCGAAPWNVEMCDADKVLALTRASAEMAVVIAEIHRHSLTTAGTTAGLTAGESR